VICDLIWFGENDSWFQDEIWDLICDLAYLRFKSFSKRICDLPFTGVQASSYFLRPPLVGALTLLVNASKVGNDDGDRQGDDKHAAQWTNASNKLADDCVRYHVAVSVIQWQTVTNYNTRPAIYIFSLAKQGRDWELCTTTRTRSFKFSKIHLNFKKF